MYILYKIIGEYRDLHNHPKHDIRTFHPSDCRINQETPDVLAFWKQSIGKNMGHSNK